MSSIPHVPAVQPLDLQPRALPQIGIPSAGMRLVGALLSRLRHLFRHDEPGSAVLRELGIDQERGRCASCFDEIQGGLESSRMRSLDAIQGWRGS